MPMEMGHVRAAARGNHEIVRVLLDGVPMSTPPTVPMIRLPCVPPPEDTRVRRRIDAKGANPSGPNVAGESAAPCGCARAASRQREASSKERPARPSAAEWRLSCPPRPPVQMPWAAWRARNPCPATEDQHLHPAYTAAIDMLLLSMRGADRRRVG